MSLCAPPKYSSKIPCTRLVFPSQVSLNIFQFNPIRGSQYTISRWLLLYTSSVRIDTHSVSFLFRVSSIGKVFKEKMCWVKVLFLSSGAWDLFYFRCAHLQSGDLVNEIVYLTLTISSLEGRELSSHPSWGGSKASQSQPCEMRVLP